MISTFLFTNIMDQLGNLKTFSIFILKGNFESGTDSDSQDEKYTPLPTDVAEGGDHKGTFGKCRYVYYGKHSEGNRFIVNNDL